MGYVIVLAIGFVGGLVAGYFIDIYVFVQRIIEKIKNIIGAIKG